MTNDEQSMTNDTLLQVRGMAKRYGRLAALSDVSFTIRSGEVLGIIGPNGSGKTTLFECLGGVLPSDAGTVLREGRPLSAAQQIDALFYLPDLVAPWPARTVRWALAFVVGYWGRRVDGITVELVIRRLELDPLLDVVGVQASRHEEASARTSPLRATGLLLGRTSESAAIRAHGCDQVWPVRVEQRWVDMVAPRHPHRVPKIGPPRFLDPQAGSAGQPPHPDSP